MDKIIKKFQSKKNLVCLISHPKFGKCVKKTHKSLEGFKNEIQILNLFAERVPKIFSYDTNTIYMEFIEGNLLLDEVMISPLDKQADIAKKVIDFLKWFMIKTGLKIPYDFNYRNFIIKDDLCYGIDFENTKEGDIKECLAKLVAFCYLYDFDCQKKIVFCSSLLKFAKVGVDEIYDFTIAEVCYLLKRRGLDYQEKQLKMFLSRL